LSGRVLEPFVTDWSWLMIACDHEKQLAELVPTDDFGALLLPTIYR
jgi:hypothetical protein